MDWKVESDREREREREGEGERGGERDDDDDDDDNDDDDTGRVLRPLLYLRRGGVPPSVSLLLTNLKKEIYKTKLKGGDGVCVAVVTRSYPTSPMV